MSFLKRTNKSIIKLSATVNTKGPAGGSAYEPPVWARLLGF